MIPDSMTKRTRLLTLCFCYVFIGHTLGKAHNPNIILTSGFNGYKISPAYDTQLIDGGKEDSDGAGKHLMTVTQANANETIPLNVAQADLHTLASDLNDALGENIDKMEEELLSSIDIYEDFINNATQRMASKLQCKFTKRLAESITIMTKIFALTSSDIEQITSQLESVSELPTEIEAITTMPTTTIAEVPTFPENCDVALRMGLPTGVVTLKTGTNKRPQRVWCDQETDGGGWIVILRRQPQIDQLDFRRNWQDYANGFGDPYGEYWIGLETLHQLTRGGAYQLKVKMKADKDEASAMYNVFRVLSPEKKYKLRVGGYNISISTGGNAMAYHNGQIFTTYDEDNDGASGGNCANWSGGGGWWYDYCFMANPTGLHPLVNDTTENDRYMEWRTWKGHHVYLSHLVMMIRRITP